MTRAPRCSSFRVRRSDGQSERSRMRGTLRPLARLLGGRVPAAGEVIVGRADPLPPELGHSRVGGRLVDAEGWRARRWRRKVSRPCRSRPWAGSETASLSDRGDPHAPSLRSGRRVAIRITEWSRSVEAADLLCSVSLPVQPPTYQSSSIRIVVRLPSCPSIAMVIGASMV